MELRGKQMPTSRFEDFEFRHIERTADSWLHADPPAKTFSVLRCLLDRAGQLVTKEKLLAEIWPETYVSDAVMKVHPPGATGSPG
jgi:DNA-binding winged helix-turn-helix (wHTH) protein